MFTIESFKKKYGVEETEILVKGRRFRFFVPKSLDAFLDSEDVFHDFPLWAKIWEASIVLSDYLAGRTPDPKKRFLEIGCGLGVAGIVASSFGHRVVMTEYNSDALNFVRANALLNGISDVETAELDWRNPQLNGPFDCIIGSEVVYKKEDFEVLMSLFKTLLLPEGEIILAEGVRKTSFEFFGKMQAFFNIEARKKVFRSKDEERKVILAIMKWKSRQA